MPKRRELLKTVGTGAVTAGLLGVAGCTQNDSEGGDGSDGGSGGDSSDSGSDGSDGGSGGGGDDGDGESGSDGGTTTPDAPDSITFGVAMPLSGALGAVGQRIQNGMLVAQQQAEAEHSGLSVELEFEDTEYDPSQGLQAARRLKEQKDVDIIVGPANTSSAVSVAEYSAQENILNMQPAAASASLTGADCQRTMFRTIPVGRQSTQLQMEYMMNEFGGNAAVLAQDSNWGQSAVEDFKQIASAQNGQIVEEQFIGLTANDFTAPIQRLSDSGADFIVTRIAGQQDIAFMQQANSSGLLDNFPYGGYITLDAIMAAPEVTTGLYTPGYFAWEEDDSAIQNWVETYREVSDDQYVFQNSFAAHLSVSMPIEAAANAGTTATDDLIDELEGLETEEPIPGRLRECDHQIDMRNWLAEITQSGTADIPTRDIVATADIGEHIVPCSESGCSF